MLSGKPIGSKGPSRRNSAINRVNLSTLAENAKHAATIAISGATGVATVCGVAFPIVKTYMTVERIEKDIERMEKLQKEMAKKLGIN